MKRTSSYEDGRLRTATPIGPDRPWDPDPRPSWIRDWSKQGGRKEGNGEKLKFDHTEPFAIVLSRISSCNIMMSTSIQSLHDGMAMKLGNFHKLDVPHRTIVTVKSGLDSESCQTAPVSSKEFRCDTCYEQFDYVSELMFHEHEHNGRNCMECQVCGRLFQNSSDLKDHYNIHTNERPYKCELCAKAFTQSSFLLAHKHTHVLEKTYKCDICGKMFKDASNFLKHKRLHSRSEYLKDQEQVSSSILSEKPYRCSYCEKAFKRTSDLKDHERVHTGERPYRCRICDKCFTQSSVLTGHMRIHTGEKPFHCNVCGKTFNNSSNFKKHQRTHSIQDIIAKVKMDDISLSKRPLRIKNSISYTNDIGAFFNKKDLSRMVLNDFKFISEKKIFEESNEKLFRTELSPASNLKEHLPFKTMDTGPKQMIHVKNEVVLASPCSIQNGHTAFHVNVEDNPKPKLSMSPTYECSNATSPEAENINYCTKGTQDIYVEISDTTDEECDDDHSARPTTPSFQYQTRDPKTKAEIYRKERQSPYEKTLNEDLIQCDNESCQENIKILRYRYTKRLTNDHDQRYDLAVIVDSPPSASRTDCLSAGRKAEHNGDVTVVFCVLYGRSALTVSAGKLTAGDVTDIGMARRPRNVSSGRISTRNRGRAPRCLNSVRWSLESRDERTGNQGKHRVTKRGPALSNPMFTLVTSEDIAESASNTPIQRCMLEIQRQNKVLDFLLRPTMAQQDPDHCCVSNNDIAIHDAATSRIASDIVVKLVSVTVPLLPAAMPCICL
ncbi:unnamed protein product [Ranitomeya imitator]|uniref:C2H2-type domain-containing protein n=1 Tax=Ranitomeya imitator TaxID=111125 RepID=A0ABN9M5F5_9NEOB|nr:unnamed protein product [Ranitomeya imitator]